VASNDHQRRPGKSVRSVSQASVTPSATHKGMVNTTSNTVLTNSSPTRGRKTSVTTVDQPVCKDTPMT